MDSPPVFGKENDLFRAVTYKDNLKAYEHVENLEGFTSAEALGAYRRDRLAMAAPLAELLTNLVASPFSLLDIGSGSSCLLYLLEKQGSLTKGVGVEASPSRHLFAEAWRKDESFQRVSNLHGDILELTLPEEKFDVCTISDNTLAYFLDGQDRAADRLLERAASLLRPGGLFIVQVSTLPFEVKTARERGEALRWRELPPSDKFRYALYRFVYDEATGVMMADTRHLGHQPEMDSRKVEFFTIYNSASIEAKLAANFTDLKLWSDFRQAPYIDDSSECMIAVARKKEVL